MNIEQFIGWLNTLYGLPAVALVFGSCVVWGYVLRFIDRFPNSGIPVAVVLWGAIAMSLVADSRSSSMSLRIWVVRNVLVGLIVGLMAWIVHKTLLSRFEGWLATKFNLGGTQFFTKKNGTADPSKPEGPDGK